jgi:hypothetical protein
VGEIEKGTSAWQSPLNIGDRIAMIGILKKSALKMQLIAEFHSSKY